MSYSRIDNSTAEKELTEEFLIKCFFNSLHSIEFILFVAKS